MNKYKHYVQNGWDKLRTTASRVVAEEEEELDEAFIELAPHAYTKLRKIADEHQTTVQSIVHYALEQYLNQPNASTSTHITLEQKEKNPLLYLDAITKQLN